MHPAKPLLAFVAALLASQAARAGEAYVSEELRSTTANVFPVILVFHDNDDAAAKKQREEKVRQLGGSNYKHHEGVGLGTLNANRALLDELKKDNKIRSIVPDRTISSLGSSNYDQPEVRTVVGLTSSTAQTGTGVGVAVIDSGVNKLAGFGTSGSCATSRVVYSENFASDSGTADLYGHGTHVASILGSNADCDTSYATSVAPGVKIVNLRVLNSLGIASDSQVVMAIDRAIALKSTYNIRVMNLSLGRPVFDTFANDPLCQAVERAWKAGIVVVVAAGNMGRFPATDGYATTASPANDPYVITVGAMRDPSSGAASRSDDTIATYSSKGPSPIDHVVKPDLVAPGNLMLARTVFPSTLTTLFPGNTKTYDGVSGQFFKLSGTSMAAPVVSGAAALLIQKDATLTPDQVKARLMKTAWKGMVATASIYDSATGVTYNEQHDIFTVGAGYLDISAALASTEKISSTQSALSPCAVVQKNGQVVLTTSYPNLSGLSIVWGTTLTWGTSVVWGTNVLQANNALSGSSVVWGSNVSSAYTVIWGTSVVWGSSLAFSLASEAGGDAVN